MKFIAFKDGLGNQLFQYKFYQYLRANSHSKTIYGYYNPKWLKAHNGLEIYDYFDVPYVRPCICSSFVCFILRALNKFFPIITTENNFKSNAFFYVGYWQDKKYWHDFNGFSFKKLNLDAYNSSVLGQIRESNSVFIHIRRGDYLLPENAIYNVCTMDYYKSAIDVIKEKITDATFFVFSDDMEWVKNNLVLDNAVYIDKNTGKSSIIDMYLMSYCKAAIIANSSFSFWGAMNGVEKNVVIYPKNWKIKATGIQPNIFKDDWIAL